MLCCLSLARAEIMRPLSRPFIQVKGQGDMDQCDNSDDGEKWPDSELVSKLKQ